LIQLIVLIEAIDGDYRYAAVTAGNDILTAECAGAALVQVIS
jgi:hypothetical protein